MSNEGPEGREACGVGTEDDRAALGSQGEGEGSLGRSSTHQQDARSLGPSAFGRICGVVLLIAGVMVFYLKFQFLQDVGFVSGMVVFGVALGIIRVGWNLARGKPALGEEAGDQDW
jgi:hypothetical protein